jgi:hypothetical protein
MLTQWCLLAYCLIRIEGQYSCKYNPVLPSVGTLQSNLGTFCYRLVFSVSNMCVHQTFKSTFSKHKLKHKLISCSQVMYFANFKVKDFLPRNLTSYINCQSKGSIVRDITPCSTLEVNWCFWRTCHFHPQSQRISQARNLVAWFILWHWRWWQHVPLTSSDFQQITWHYTAQDSNSS